jgi:hypothetical protein
MLKKLMRKLLIVSVLIAMSIAMLLTGEPARATCPYDLCESNWRDCVEWCNGDPVCESVHHCDEFYTDCMCTNCGACPLDGPPPPSN